MAQHSQPSVPSLLNPKINFPIMLPLTGNCLVNVVWDILLVFSAQNSVNFCGSPKEGFPAHQYLISACWTTLWPSFWRLRNKNYKYSFVPIWSCLTTSLVTNGPKSSLFLSCHTSIFLCSFTNIKYKYYWRSFQDCQHLFSEMYSRMKPYERTSLEITQLVFSGKKNGRCFCERGSYFLKYFERKSKGNLWLLFWKWYSYTEHIKAPNNHLQHTVWETEASRKS